MMDGISARLPTLEDPRRDNLNLKDAAGKFEALLITQMLKSARETDSGGWSGDTDQSGSAIMDMADQHLADLLGAQGGLGVARMVVEHLGPRIDKSQP